MNASQGALVLMMAGGTGGHVYPALAVASELRDRGYRIEWVGTRRGLEQRVVPAAGIQLHHLAVRGVRGKGLVDRLLGLGALALASLQALWLVLRRWPACVVGMGGYVAGPAGVAAWLLRRPLLIHEQNAVAGTTNRMLAPLADSVVAGFPDAFRPGIDFQVLGNPVRAELVAAGTQAAYDYAGQRPLRLLVLGGSLGARPINELVPAAAGLVESAGLQLDICHQAGEAHADAVAAAYPDAAGERRVVAFIENMDRAYAWADLVVCRAGALTVAELAVMGRPAILIPLPHAIDDHQTANARSLSDRGAAVLMPQADLTAQRLANAIQRCIQEPAELRAMARASLATATPGATGAVADRCEELLGR